jgi:membrane complex biogenesis BtpA family protein
MNNFPKVKKPIIALLHLNSFPGDPFYNGWTMKEIVAQAAKDLDALQKGGVDAILFTNEFSIPYRNVADHMTTAAMGRIIGELRRDIGVSYGVGLLQDPINIIDLAVAVDADFIREQLTGAFVGEGGIFQTNIAETLRRRQALGAMDLKMFYFLFNEADSYLNDRDYKTVVRSMIFKCKPDGICVPGLHAGDVPDTQFLADMKAAAAGDTDIYCNTGCTRENIRQKLDASDGAFVGTTFKVDGKFHNFIDPDRVKNFMDEVREYRKTL